MSSTCFSTDTTAKVLNAPLFYCLLMQNCKVPQGDLMGQNAALLNDVVLSVQLAA